MTQEYSREFLEEAWKEAKKHLPGWLYACLLQSARARSGGRAKARVDEPDAMAKLALGEIKPRKLKQVDDEDLRAIWLRLHQWYANARRRKQAVENIVNAALWVKAELERRDQKIGESELVDAVRELEEVGKARAKNVSGERGKVPDFLEGMLEGCPDEVLLVRDFVSVAGSAAVVEKPGDIDVVVRAEYDVTKGAYSLDGSGLWVALRRFMSPDKSGPQIQLLGSPQGSFTDYVPVFDLVARRREPHVQKIEPSPPSYHGQERVIKQARAATPKIVAQAERAKKDDRLTVGEFFYQPKPTRGARDSEPQSLDSLVKVAESIEDFFPAWVQKKYDGARHQVHRKGADVIIFSEDGDDNTERLPGIVKEVKALPGGDLVLDAELEKWDGEQHLPREAVAGYLASKDEPDDRDLTLNVFDVLAWGNQDVHGKPYRERLELLRKLGKGTMERPSPRKRLNIAPGVEVKGVEGLRKETERIRKLKGSEGIVAKSLSAPYFLDHATKSTWLKYHNATTIRALVTKATRTKGGAYTYQYAVKPGEEKIITLDASKLHEVGETFSTSRRFRPGDKILIEAETVNKVLGPDGVQLTAWVPRVLGTYEGEPDTVDRVVNRAIDNLVLQAKRVQDDEIEYLPANVAKAALRPQVPSKGPVSAAIAFVGASPSKQEAARREPFVGPAGETFNELYLEPLGLARDKVFLTNAVPRLLVDEEGKTREPTVEEIKEWKDWLNEELDKAQPRLIVALGRTAEGALDGRADFVLPHPSAVRRFGDSGEVGRKLKRIKERLVDKQIPKPLLKPRAEGGTRSTAAEAHWEKNWYKALPKSGKGKFVYQHHWRGLDEEEAKQSEQQLINSDHSLHGDLRLEGENGAWGFAVLLGRTEDNKGREKLDKLIGWEKGDNIELAPKLDQPKEWLNVGVDKPMVSGPGEVGATSEKFSKFFALDKGTYELGVARQHMVEIFLDGSHLKGRYLLMYAPVAGRRRWLIDKPEDQTPMAERRDLADLLSELKRKRQRFLFWASPGQKPIQYDVQTGRVVNSEDALTVQIQKADPVKKIVYGVVVDPYGKNGPQPDAHNDWIPPSTVEAAAHDFMRGQRVIGLQHKSKANAHVVESWVEMYPTPKDYHKALRGEAHRVARRSFGDDVVHSGSWVLGVALGDKEWKAFQDGEINAFSPGGTGFRSPMSRQQLPDIVFVDLVPKEQS